MLAKDLIELLAHKFSVSGMDQWKTRTRNAKLFLRACILGEI